MSTQPPERSPHDYDEVTRLRLQLAHTEMQRDALKAAAMNEALKVVRVSIIQATIDLDEENARLKADLQLEKENEDRLVREWQKANNEVHGLKSQVAALIDDQARLKAEVTDLKSTADRLKAEVERLRKAGDWMFNAIILNSDKDMGQAMDAWHAAKEGKPAE